MMVVLLLLGCEGEVGGNCSYERETGTCTWTGSADGVVVDFEGQDGGSESDALTGFAAECLEELGYVEGDSFTCIHSTIAEGTCSPDYWTAHDCPG